MVRDAMLVVCKYKLYDKFQIYLFHWALHLKNKEVYETHHLFIICN